MTRGRFSNSPGPMSEGSRVWLAIGLLCGLLAASSQATAEPAGLVLTEVPASSALEKAGLEPADILLSWELLPNPTSPQGVQGELHSPFDWDWLEVEHAPRGSLRLNGKRNEESRAWTVEPGLWKAKVRPTLSATQLAEYRRGQELAAAGNLDGAAAVWQELADQDQDGLLRCWFYRHLGETWLTQRVWEKAHMAFRSALESTHEPVARVAVWSAIGRLYTRQSNFDHAEASFRSALEVYRETWNENLGFALGLNSLGIVAAQRGRVEVAKEHFQQALVIRERLAPDSLHLATNLNNLGNVARDQGQLAEAADYLQRALAIKRKLAPDGLHMAIGLSNLGTVALKRGRLDEGVEHLQRALAIEQELAPDSLGVANSLNSLGIATRKRGQLDQAADYLQRALEIEQKLAPDSLEVAASLNSLGNVYFEQGQHEEATRLYQQALEIREILAPDGLEMATSLNNLGSVAFEGGHYDKAAKLYRKALNLKQRVAPDSLDVASSLNSLGVLAYHQGRLEVATEHLQRALAIEQQLAPDSLEMATSLNDLGKIAKERGHIDLAESYFDRSLDALEGQIGYLGGSQWVKGGFRAQHRRLYRDAMELLLQNNRSQDAFAILERSRARSFLAMLEERDFIFSDIPEDLDRQRRSLGVRHDRTLRQMASLSSTEDRARIETLRGELTRVYQERDELRAKIRQQSPHLANLQEPQPLTLEAVQEILDPATVMLSYSVAEHTTDLFVVTPGRPLDVHTLAVGEDTLQAEVGYFRKLIDAAQSDDFLGHRRKEEAEKVGKRLYDWLVAPAQDAVAAGDRVLLILDGPLQRLPFAALLRDIGDNSAAVGRDWQYFAEWKPLHSVLSATVYAELAQSRPNAPSTADSGPLLAAFGDPYYLPNPEPAAFLGESKKGDTSDGGRPITDVRVRSTRDRCGFDLRRLPASRQEVLGISALYRNVRTYLGQGAREESVKSLDAEARILHIAAHGCLDDRFPLNSGLFLTLPEGFPKGRDNGLLQAWEIFESVRLNADLVVLSACESGLGEEQGGEGLIGLTRAFQYAGARTVAATLWQVEDQVTAELMVRFYRHLRAGKTKDVALRAAQIELIQGPIAVRNEDGQVRQIDASAPYYWAAFQLLGDWQ